MVQYTLKRLLLFVPTLLFVSLIVFVSARLIPGDPAQSMLADTGGGGGGSSAAYLAMRARLGLDEPLVPAYARWAAGVVTGDLGTSMRNGLAVADTFRQRLPITVELAGLSFLMTLVIALPLGVVAGARAGGWVDYAIRLPAVLLMAVPHFWVATLAVVVPFQLWGYVAPLNYTRISEDLGVNLATMLRPVTVMSLTAAAPIIRMTRTNLLEVLGSDYLRTARAKGLAGNAVLFRHALPNALIPTIEVILSRVAVLLGGVIVMETVFGLPGLGRSMVDAVAWRDYTLLQALVLFNAVVVLAVNLLADLVYAWVDPRVTYGS